MAHYQQLKFVETVGKNFPDFFQNKKVLEVGSWIVNETIRDFFKNCDYVGADIAEGPGVDVACAGEDLDFADGSFDVVVSCECFEHNPRWKPTFANMYRMLNPNGLFLMTCATIGRSEHGTSRKSPNSSLTVDSGHDDHYQNLSKSDISKNFDLDKMFNSYEMFYNIYANDLYFIGFKKSSFPTHVFSTNFRSKIAAITRIPEPSHWKKFEKFFNFWSTFVYASALGEFNYHDFKYKIGKILKKKS